MVNNIDVDNELRKAREENERLRKRIAEVSAVAQELRTGDQGKTDSNGVSMADDDSLTPDEESESNAHDADSDSEEAEAAEVQVDNDYEELLDRLSFSIKSNDLATVEWAIEQCVTHGDELSWDKEGLLRRKKLLKKAREQARRLRAGVASAPNVDEDEDETKQSDVTGVKPEEGPDCLVLAQLRLTTAKECKDRGNAAIKTEDFTVAEKEYTNGILKIAPLLETDESGWNLDQLGDPTVSSILLEARDLEISLFLNLSLVQLKTEEYKAARDSAGFVLGKKPSEAKALYRRALANKNLGEYEAAAADFHKVLQLGPNADAKRELAALEKTQGVKVSKLNTGLDNVWKSAFNKKDTKKVEDVDNDGSAQSMDDDASVRASATPATAARNSNDQRNGKESVLGADATLRSEGARRTEVDEVAQKRKLEEEVKKAERLVEEKLAKEKQEDDEKRKRIEQEVRKRREEQEQAKKKSDDESRQKVKEAIAEAARKAEVTKESKPSQQQEQAWAGNAGREAVARAAEEIDEMMQNLQKKAEEESKRRLEAEHAEAERRRIDDEKKTRDLAAKRRTLMDQRHQLQLRKATSLKEMGNAHLKKSDELKAADHDGVNLQLLEAMDNYGKGIVQVAQLTGDENLSDAIRVDAEQLETSLHLNMSFCQIKLEQYEGAVASADEALRIQPKNVKGLFRRAQARKGLSKEDHEEALENLKLALEDFKEVVTIEPQNAEARKAVAELRAELRKVNREGGVEDAETSGLAGMFGDPKLVKEKQKNAKEKRRQEEITRIKTEGNDAHRMGNYALAERLYKQALDMDPQNTALILNHAAALIMTERLGEAFAGCEAVVKIEPKLAKAYVRGARCLQLQGKLEEAEAFVMKGFNLVSDGDKYELSEQIGSIRRVRQSVSKVENLLTADLQGANEGKQALLLLDEAARLGAPVTLVRELRLRALLQSKETKHGDEAKKLSGEVLREAGGKTSRDMQLWRGSALLLAGEREDAKPFLRKAAGGTDTAPKDEDQAEPQDTKPTPEQKVQRAAQEMLDRVLKSDKLKGEGNALFSSRKWEEAVEKYEDALKSAVGDPEMLAIIHTNIAAVMRRLGQRSQEALSHASKAIEIRPKFAKAFFRRGVIHYDEGRWNQAFEDFRRADQLEPNFQGLDDWIRRARHAVSEGKDRKNHYKVLGVLCDVADAAEIKKKYRRLAMECHPDKIQGCTSAEKKEAEIRFKAANEAHETLSDPEKKRTYDFGEDHHHGMHFGGGGFHPHQRRRPQPRSRGSPWGGHSGFGGFSEEFFFG